MCSSSWPLSLSYMTFTENPSSASHLRSATYPAPLNPTRKMWLAKIYPTRVWCATKVHHDYYYYYYYCYYYRIATLTRHWLALSLKGVNLSDVSWTDSRQTYLPTIIPTMDVCSPRDAGRDRHCTVAHHVGESGDECFPLVNSSVVQRVTFELFFFVFQLVIFSLGGK